MSPRLPSHMQFSHGPLLIIWHARQSSANLFRQPEPLWTSTDHELMRGCLQLVMHVAWTSTAARPCAMQHVDFQRASVMRAGSLRCMHVATQIAAARHSCMDDVGRAPQSAVHAARGFIAHGTYSAGIQRQLGHTHFQRGSMATMQHAPCTLSRFLARHILWWGSAVPHFSASVAV